MVAKYAAMSKNYFEFGCSSTSYMVESQMGIVDKTLVVLVVEVGILDNTLLVLVEVVHELVVEGAISKMLVPVPKQHDAALPLQMTQRTHLWGVIRLPNRGRRPDFNLN